MVGSDDVSAGASYKLLFVGCFLFNGHLRQYFILYRAVSLGVGGGGSLYSPTSGENRRSTYLYKTDTARLQK